MKLSTNTDFTRLPRVGAVRQAAEDTAAEPFATVLLEHDERQLRRKVLKLEGGEQILVDLPEPARLDDGDLLLLDDGRSVRVAAADEELYEIRPGRMPLRHLAWHIGSRHLAAQIDEDRILIRRGPENKAMLEALGAIVSEVVAPFHPLQGKSHGQAPTHAHGGGERDKFGRLPGDPHYGHNHA